MLNNKVVLITGGTGSFGKAFVKRILATENPKKVIVFSRDELKQSEMQQEIHDDRMRYFLGDVRDRDRLYRAFERVDIVVHAVALKQVPAAEYNPSEFMKTNIIGTDNVLMAASDRWVEKVLFLSTDKASAPVTAYGSSKSMAEHLVQSGQSYSTYTRFATLRYGNVAGSRGSIIPIWRAIPETQKLSVTDSSMSRFFFTLNNAVASCLWALEAMAGGELFVPKMPSFYITDLAAAFKREYCITGVRGVEKLSEVLVSADESRYFSDCGDYYTRFRAGVTAALPAKFVYSSACNEHWLGPADLELLLENL